MKINDLITYAEYKNKLTGQPVDLLNINEKDVADFIQTDIYKQLIIDDEK